jgi:hypothetical protein
MLALDWAGSQEWQQAELPHLEVDQEHKAILVLLDEIVQHK